MADHILETKIQLRYGTYNQWMNSDVILRQGEAAIAIFPDTIENNPPKAVGIKIGNGRAYFDELPWVQAIAADVYSWAKESTKPTYSATEIEGLQTFIEQYGGGGQSAISGSAYRLVYNTTTNKYILQYYDDTVEDWIDTSSNIDLSSILKRLNDLERFANGEQGNLGNIQDPLMAFIYDGVLTYLNRLDFDDSEVQHQFVTSVSEVNGKISVTRKALDASDITTGTLQTSQGGIGLTRVESDELLGGSTNGNITVKTISSNINTGNNTDIPTSGAVISYVTRATAGLTGAMHFVGEATVAIEPNSHVDPQISNYNFNNVQMGDVILANNTQEFVWEGNTWRLLGDEGSYAIKGSITNADISEEAAISMDKIADLIETLNTKVDKEEGKTLSSNDYTDEDKDKLTAIEDYAQENVIEHIFLNDNELSIGTINGNPKSINLQLILITQEQIEKLGRIEDGAQVNIIEHILLNGIEIAPATIENVPNSVNIQINEFDSASQTKLQGIEAEAQVNKIEKIIYDGVEITPDTNKTVSITSDPHTEHENVIEQIFINDREQPVTNKQVRITIDQEALNLNVVAGAEVPKENGVGKDEIEQIQKKLQFERIAISGDVKDLKQTNDTYIILNCGSSTEVI